MQDRAMKQIDLREGARRQHRVVALFAVIQCWLRGLDGLAFERRQLERLLGLVRFKGTRVEWLREDFKEFFPYQEVCWFTGKNHSLGSVIISRVPIAGSLLEGSMATKARVAKVQEGGPKLGMFELWVEPGRDLNKAFEGLMPFFADRANFDERFLASYGVHEGRHLRRRHHAAHHPAR
jgi:hypothetical protein